MTPQALAQKIDHTLLKPDTRQRDIIKLCEEAKTFGFYAVCVNPYYVELSASLLQGSSVKVAVVIGFPLGAQTLKTKLEEAREMKAKGADELDMVLNLGALKSQKHSFVLEEIQSLVEATPSCLVKVILETSLLTDEEKKTACLLAKTAGAHFVKTSTGFHSGGATLKDVRLMKKVVGSIGVKASGGIRHYKEALALIEAGASRLGTSSGVQILKEAT